MRGGQYVDGAAPAPTLDIRQATDASVLLVFISVLMAPLVFAHLNGFTVIGVELPERGSRTKCLGTAQSWSTAATSASELAFLLGE